MKVRVQTAPPARAGLTIVSFGTVLSMTSPSFISELSIAGAPLLAAPPVLFSNRLAWRTGTGASGLSRSAAPYTDWSSMKSPTTRAVKGSQDASFSIRVGMVF